MNYSIIETNLSYEQFRDRYEKHVETSPFGGRKDLDKEIYLGSISKNSFMLGCGLPPWRSGTNWLTGDIVEEDGKCILIYKMTFPDGFYKWGKKILLAVFLFNVSILLISLYWKGLFGRCYMGCFMISLFAIVAAIPISNTKKEGEYCKKKLNEIIADDMDKCEENLFERTRKIQAEVIMLDNFHNPKLLVCQETRADGVQIQYYKDKENECFIEKIGDFVTVEIDEADESKYRILEGK